MNRRTTVFAFTALFVTAWAYACGDGTVEPPPPDPPRPTTVTVNPATAQLVSLGATTQLSAEVRDQNGNAMAGTTVTWSGSDATVATVDASGLVTAVDNGVATVTATAGSVSGTAAVTVEQVPAEVTAEPAAHTLVAFGDTIRLSAEALDANGNVVATAEFAWSSGDTTIATVDASGLVTAAANGVATVTATAGSVSGTAAVTVEQVPAEVTAEPAAHTLVAFGDTIRLSAEALDANGNVVATAEFAWSSGDTTIATVDASGLVTAAANGVATVTATAGPASGTAVVTVAQEVGAVTVSPAADTVLMADTVRLSAGATDANGHPVPDAEFAWASGDTLVAVVDGEGLVTGVSGGEAEITATSAGVTGGARLTVMVPAPATVAVSPDTVTLTAFGQTAQLTTEVRDQAGRVMEGVPVSWSSGDTLVATVDSAGLVTAVGGGRTAIAAMAESASGETTVIVTQSAGSVVVSPVADTITPGDTLRLVAEALDESGHVIEGAEFDWSSSDVSVARVDASGVVTGLAEGRATITAVADEASGTSEITVENPDRAALVALYEATDGPNWLNNENWLTGAPAGEWYGVTTDALGRVRGLSLGNNQLSGAIPPELGGLSSLRYLGLHLNDLSGTIPPELGGLSNLQSLQLNGNELGGAIPPELGRLSNLESLYLLRNDLSGAIPPELGDLLNLTTLDLQRNELSGAIPPELGGLSNLRYLELNDNLLLSGAIPPELGGLSNLVSLNLGGNSLSGVIPPELGGLSNLQSLQLNGNELGGAIPPELGRLSNLTFVWLGGNSLSGAIPPELGRLSNLRTLSLYSNDLSGIPPELGELSNLEHLWLSYNALSGAIPPELGGLSNLVSLNLGGNSLSGVIPPELGGLSNLQSLQLNGNELGGAIPAELGRLSNLERLLLDSNELSGAIPPELGRLSNLERLYLHENELSGAIPPELGGLSNLKWLLLDSNEELSGAIPSTLRKLSLRYLSWGVLHRLTGELSSRGPCAPGTSAFVEWLDDLEAWRGPFCNASDQAALTSFYELAAGGEWTESDGWLTGPALEEWHGVESDSLGRVTGLELSDNGLSGGLPGTIGNLGQLTGLRIDGNELGGRLPLSLTALDLEVFHYTGTDLCEPSAAEFRTWLEGIPSRRGTEVQCAPPTDRDALVALYEGTGGPGWRNDGGWLTAAPLRDWHGVEVDAQGRVIGLILSENELSGEIPPELGELSNLEYLWLPDNALSGEIPPELGGLSNLERLVLGGNELLSGAIPPELGGLSNLEGLDLSYNELSGAIPPELGGLSNLRWLFLHENELSGAIPPELGRLSNLEPLYLSRNELSGAIPPELGRLSNLERLYLHENELSGAIPPELGRLSNLERLFLHENELSGAIPPELGRLSNLEGLALWSNELSGAIPSELGGLSNLTGLTLSHNSGLAGAMPESLVNLELESLLASGTELCVPRGRTFEEWLATIPRRWIAVCGEPAAYLVQAVQSRTHPVPLVAGEDALLRVFITAATETTEGLPEVRARFYLNGTERHVADVPRSSTPIPTQIDEGDLSKSANAEVPGRIVRPGLEMVVEIDPGGALDPGLGVPRRIPEEGRLAIEVREMPVLDLTVIPFLWRSNPDSAIIGLVEGMAADPEGHALLEDTHVLLPVADLNVTAHAPVASTSNNTIDLLRETEAIRVLEGGGGHYMGMMSGRVTGPGGVAIGGGRSNYSRPGPRIIAHELGHNMSLGHAPCGGAGGPDPSFPDPRGAIGAWGYDIRHAHLVATTRKDHMGYCQPTWTSDYHFTKALRHRLVDEGASSAALHAAQVRSLLLWGGGDTTGTAFLNPAFVADAPPTLPDSAGDYTVTGRDASGQHLFSLSFAMPVALSEEGEVSSFAFALPIQPGWEEALASVTLSGPDGTATLNSDSDMPMAILRDPRSGQVRAILRDAAAASATGAAAAAFGGARMPQDFEVLFSRGIPDTGAWRR